MVATSTIIAGAAIAASAAATGAALSQSGGGGQSTEPRNYGQETRDTLQAQIDLAPQLYAANKEYQPKYDALNLKAYEGMLLGSPGGNQTTESYTDWEPLWIPENALPKPWGEMTGSEKQYWGDRLAQAGQGTPGAGTGPTGAPRVNAAGQGDGGQNAVAGSYGPGYGGGPPVQGNGQQMFGGEQVQRPVQKSRTVTQPEQKGLLSLMENEVAPAVRRQAAADAEAQLALLKDLGPRAVTAIQGLDPTQSRLVQGLSDDAEAGLAAGSKLDPAMRREVEQDVRGAQAARGFGFGPTDVFEEAFGLGSAGEALKERRLARAGAVTGLRKSLYQDPVLAEFGAPSSFSTNASQQILGNAQGSATTGANTLFNPQSPYAMDIYNTNFNAAEAARIAAANRSGALTGSLIGAGGTIAGGYLAGGGGYGNRVGKGYGNSFGLVN